MLYNDVISVSFCNLFSFFLVRVIVIGSTAFSTIIFSPLVPLWKLAFAVTELTFEPPVVKILVLLVVTCICKMICFFKNSLTCLM